MICLDKCEPCYHANQGRKELDRLKLKYDNAPIATWTEYDRQLYETMESHIDAVDKHREFVNHQHTKCKYMMQSVQPGRLVAVMDYKAKINLGESRVQLNHEFYEAPMRSLLGVTVMVNPDDFERVLRDPAHSGLLMMENYRVENEIDPEQAPVGPAIPPSDRRGTARTLAAVGPATKPYTSRKPWKVHFEFVFDVVSQNGFQTIQGLKAFFEHPLIKALQPQKVDFWSDNGSHFKNKEVYRYFSDLKQPNVEWHHFAPKHGKSVCDTRFATLSNWFNSYKLTEAGCMRSSQDIIQVIGEFQLRSNKCRVQQNQRPIISFQEFVPVGEMPAKADILQFNGARALFSYSVDPRTREVSAALSTGDDISDVSFDRKTVPRSVANLTKGLPNPVDSVSLKCQSMALKSITKLQKQRRLLGDNQFVSPSIAATTPLPASTTAVRKRPPAARSAQKTGTSAHSASKRKRGSQYNNRGSDSDSESDGQRDAELVDDDFDFKPPAAKRRYAVSSSSNYSSSSAPKPNTVATRSRPQLARTQMAQTALHNAKKLDNKKKKSAADVGLLDGTREAWREDLRSAGLRFDINGGISDLWHQFAHQNKIDLVRDYEDDADDMSVDEPGELQDSPASAEPVQDFDAMDVDDN